MNLSDISTIITFMQGRMPESSRTLLAHKFVRLFGDNLTNPKDGAKLKVWLDSGGVDKFYKDCNIRPELPWVDHEISVHDSDLALFINRWMNIDKFRRPGESGFIPVTPDMHNFRITMIEELKGLAQAQERINNHEENKSRDDDVQQQPG